MAVFKGLTRADVFITDYLSKKHWSIPVDQIEDYGIQCIRSYSGSALFSHNLYQSYYSGSLEDGSFTGSADLCLQTTLTIPGARQLPEKPYFPTDTEASVTVFAFSSSLIGTHIEPESLNLGVNQDTLNYVEGDYVAEEDSKKDRFYFEDLSITEVTDKEGILRGGGYTGKYVMQSNLKYPVPERSESYVVGDIIYNRGLLVITNPLWAWVSAVSSKKKNFTAIQNMSWTSNVPIFTLNVSCPVRDYEFNYTYNKSAEELIGDTFFKPYITSVGLYNNSNELIAVAKLSKPIQKLDNIDMTLNIRLDIS